MFRSKQSFALWRRNCLVLIAIFVSSYSFSQPTISSCAPLLGEVGSTVVISGTNFSTTAANNVVYFGAVRAVVSNATATSLDVVVPAGASYGRLTVAVGGQIAYSSQLFLPTFTGVGIFNSNSFEAPKSFTSNSNVLSIASGDIDGDGKPELAAVSSGLVSAYRNTSSTGLINFNAKQDFAAGTGSRQVIMADISGDGRYDLVTANSSAGSVSVLKNISTTGNIAFDAKLDYPSGTFVTSVAATDFDQDGRVDVVSANGESETISIFRNTTIAGAITFATKIDLASGSTPTYLQTGDLDGDGKQDIAVLNKSTPRVSVFLNTSTPGAISFAPKAEVIVGFMPNHLILADLDQDGKIDLVSSEDNSSFFITVNRNMSVPGSVSFAAGQAIQVSTSGIPTAGDLNGDGRPDLVVGTVGPWVSVLRNTSSPGTISFANYFEVETVDPEASAVATGDLDGDGKADFATKRGSNVAVLRNRTDEAVVVPSGANPVTGVINKITRYDATVQTRNGSPYVQRHYDITPVNNPETATGTITLYFTQQDFNQFNAHPNHGANLPTGPSDNTGKANLRVFQYHGTSSTGVPGSYTGSGVVIDPVDANIVWSALNQVWSVTFNVTGFSGFFVSSAGNNILPLTLINFSGRFSDNKALLTWTTTDEVNVDRFELLRSTDGSQFKTIGTVKAKGNGNYDFADLPEKNRVNFYRLKMIDFDGRYTYSQVVSLKSNLDNKGLTLYPNPAKDFVMVIHPAFAKGATIQLIDMAGRRNRLINVGGNVQTTRLELSGLAKGIYKLVVKGGGLVNVKTISID